MNLKENILIGIQTKKSDREIFELIEKFYLNKILEKYPHEVSAGEAQRTALIRSLVNNPKLLLLDEPFSNLNKGLREELQEILRDIIKRKKISSIIVTHDYDEAFYLGDMCGVLIEQKLMQFSKPYKIYHNPNSTAVANFFNKGEFIDAKIISRNELFHSKLGVIKGYIDKKFKIGNTVKLLIQPEDLLHNDKSNLKFKIIDKRFNGASFIYTLNLSKSEKVSVIIHSHHSHNHEIGEEFGVKSPIILKHVVCF